VAARFGSFQLEIFFPLFILVDIRDHTFVAEEFACATGADLGLPVYIHSHFYFTLHDENQTRQVSGLDDQTVLSLNFECDVVAHQPHFVEIVDEQTVGDEVLDAFEFGRDLRVVLLHAVHYTDFERYDIDGVEDTVTAADDASQARAGVEEG